MATSSLDEKTAKEVLRQVEFYFSDSNIPRDNFLRKTISASEDGMVSLALICSFKKMRGYLKLMDVTAEEIPDATVQAVAETLRQSTSLKISEDGKKVGRVAALLKPEEAVEQLDARTIAASPLEYNVTQEAVESFFSQYAKVSSVRLPRHVRDRRAFCGTALVEFSTEEDAEKLLKESLTFAGVQLELKPKKDFDEERAKEEEECENSRPSKSFNGKKDSNSEANYPKGLIVAFTLKSTVTGGSTEQNGAEGPEKTKTDENGEQNGTEKGEKVEMENVSESDGKNSEAGEKPSESEGIKPEAGDKSSEDPKNDAVKESCLSTYKDDMNVVLREDLKEVFEKFGTVKYIDFKIGEESGYIRFEEPEAAQKARAAAVLSKSGGLAVKNFTATLEPVTGEAEKDYWSQICGNQGRFHNKGNRGRGGKNFRGGKHPRSRDNSWGGRPNKAQKAS